MNTNPLDTRTLETGVLGSILIDPERSIPVVMDKVTSLDFGDPVLRHIWDAIWDLYTSLEPIDPVTVSARAGAAYETKLAEIIRETPTSANVEAYASMLQEGSRLRQLQEAAGQILYAHTLKDALAAVGDLNAQVLGFPGRRAATWTQMLHGYLNRQSDKNPPDFLRWGFEQIDEIAPLRAGRFAVIGADSSVGKTAFAMQAAYTMASHGKRVAFYSYETSIEDSADRIVANAADVALPRSKRKALTAGDYARIMVEGERSDKISLEVVETAGYTTAELRAEIVAHRVEVAFIDYVQLIPGDEDNRWETVTRTSMELHVMAQQLGCTIVALSQVTLPQAKNKDGKRPTIDKHSLRESRQLTNDADLILLLDLADPDFPTGPRVLKVAKNKDGPLGGMYLAFDPEHMRFKPGRPPMPTGAPIPSKEELAADEARRNEKKPKPRPEKIDGQGTFEDLPDDGEPIPFEEG